jgi:hypothetical protein
VQQLIDQYEAAFKTFFKKYIINPEIFINLITFEYQSSSVPDVKTSVHPRVHIKGYYAEDFLLGMKLYTNYFKRNILKNENLYPFLIKIVNIRKNREVIGEKKQCIIDTVQ